YVIAELSANHGGSKDRALEVIHAAHEAGADAVKFQHYTAETITVRSDHPDFRVSGGTLWDGRQLADLYAEAMTPWEWTGDLVAEANKLGIDWLSSPFDNSAVDFLEQFNIATYKIASFELVDLPLIRYVASKGKPMIMSTGMSTLDEIDAAVKAAQDAGAPQVSILRCNSTYPAKSSEMDLAAIPTMIQKWGIPVGLSDHTMTSVTAISAVALGATIIEKHITMRRSDGGPDGAFSLEPHEFAAMIRDIREASDALGSARFGPSASEVNSLKFRRSLRAVSAIRAGDVISESNVRSVRPAGGLPPDDFVRIVGKKATRDIAVGEPITNELLG
ncbi:MAG: pseudaminic acid synthase, partial [Ilumatobacteraceae bacterium]